MKEKIRRAIQYLKEHPGAVKGIIGAICFILGVQASPQVYAIIDAILNLLGVLF